MYFGRQEPLSQSFFIWVGVVIFHIVTLSPNEAFTTLLNSHLHVIGFMLISNKCPQQNKEFMNRSKNILWSNEHPVAFLPPIS